MSMLRKRHMNAGNEQPAKRRKTIPSTTNSESTTKNNDFLDNTSLISTINDDSIDEQNRIDLNKNYLHLWKAMKQSQINDRNASGNNDKIANDKVKNCLAQWKKLLTMKAKTAVLKNKAKKAQNEGEIMKWNKYLIHIESKLKIAEKNGHQLLTAKQNKNKNKNKTKTKGKKKKEKEKKKQEKQEKQKKQGKKENKSSEQNKQINSKVKQNVAINTTTNLNEILNETFKPARQGRLAKNIGDAATNKNNIPPKAEGKAKAQQKQKKSPSPNKNIVTQKQQGKQTVNVTPRKIDKPKSKQQQDQSKQPKQATKATKATTTRETKNPIENKAAGAPTSKQKQKQKQKQKAKPKSNVKVKATSSGQESNNNNNNNNNNKTSSSGNNKQKKGKTKKAENSRLADESLPQYAKETVSSSREWYGFLDNTFDDSSKGGNLKDDVNKPTIRTHWQQGPVGTVKSWWDDDDRKEISNVYDVNEYNEYNECSNNYDDGYNQEYDDEMMNSNKPKHVRQMELKREKQRAQMRKDISKELKRQRLERQLRERMESGELVQVLDEDDNPFESFFRQATGGGNINSMKKDENDNENKNENETNEFHRKYEKKHRQLDLPKLKRIATFANDDLFFIDNENADDLRAANEHFSDDSDSDSDISDSDNDDNENYIDENADGANDDNKENKDALLNIEKIDIDKEMNEFTASMKDKNSTLSSKESLEYKLLLYRKQAKQNELLKQLQRDENQARNENSESEMDDIDIANNNSVYFKNFGQISKNKARISGKLLSDDKSNASQEKKILSKLNVMDYVVRYKDSFFKECESLNLNINALIDNWQTIKKNKKVSKKLKRKLGIIYAREMKRRKKLEKKKKKEIEQQEDNEDTLSDCSISSVSSVSTVSSVSSVSSVATSELSFMDENDLGLDSESIVVKESDGGNIADVDSFLQQSESDDSDDN